jgi:hypothetical protein
MFVAALLLSGDAEAAEAAVMEGIRRWEDDDLLQSVAAAAMDYARQGGYLQSDSTAVPKQLRPVASLPAAPRQAYVLRFLAGVPRERCAELLNTSVEQVDALSCRAAAALAGPGTEQFDRPGRETEWEWGTSAWTVTESTPARVGACDSI